MDAEGATSPDHPPREGADRHRLVARRHADRLRDAGRGEEQPGRSRCRRRPRAPSGPRRRASSSGSTTAAIGQGFVDDGYRHLFVVPASGGTPRQLTDGNYEPQRRRVDARRQADPVQLGLRVDGCRVSVARVARSTAVDVASGAITQLTRRKGPDNNPQRLAGRQAKSPTPATTGRRDTWSRQQALRDEHRRHRIRAWCPATGIARRRASPGPRTAAASTSPRRTQGSQNLYILPLAGTQADGVQPVTKGKHMLTTSTIAKGKAVGVARPRPQAGRHRRRFDIASAAAHQAAHRR